MTARANPDGSAIAFDKPLRAAVLDVERLRRIRDLDTPPCFTLSRDAASILAGAYLELLESAPAGCAHGARAGEYCHQCGGYPSVQSH
jgi:hypothetical protein